ncbi:MAG: bifunctional precorrin-2 dehydrogenase/sirohydrochlorin ferrochelatase, partial [Rubrobacteridae bacterium]|nr:bifunctional precorrin-2 dehydrogenase/sirohydrochlorin ferrochelatase [Rubrobacteridae bacterium]
MAFYPMYVNIEGLKCLVVGGGDVATRKVGSLIECDAAVSVVSPRITFDLERIQSEGRITVELREYVEGDIDGAALVIVATDNSTLNEQIYREAKEKNIPVNVVDAPDICTFIVPSIIRRGDFILSISTSGSCPALAKSVRKDLQEQFGGEYAEFCNILRQFRKNLADKYDRQEDRAEALKKFIDSDVIELIKAGKSEEVKERVRAC